ncbi:unnamed protein product, partial [Chrysoparadoxa australica]
MQEKQDEAFAARELADDLWLYTKRAYGQAQGDEEPLAVLIYELESSQRLKFSIDFTGSTNFRLESREKDDAAEALSIQVEPWVRTTVARLVQIEAGVGTVRNSYSWEALPPAPDQEVLDTAAAAAAALKKIMDQSSKTENCIKVESNYNAGDVEQ